MSTYLIFISLTQTLVLQVGSQTRMPGTSSSEVDSFGSCVFTFMPLLCIFLCLLMFLLFVGSILQSFSILFQCFCTPCVFFNFTFSSFIAEVDGGGNSRGDGEGGGVVVCRPLVLIHGLFSPSSNSYGLFDPTSDSIMLSLSITHESSQLNE